MTANAAFGNLWTFDGERFRAAALRRVPEAYLEWQLSRETAPPWPGTVLGHIAAGKAFAQIPDAALEDAYMNTDARTLVCLLYTSDAADDGERWHSAAIRGVPDDFAEFRKRNARLPDRDRSAPEFSPGSRLCTCPT